MMADTSQPTEHHWWDGPAAAFARWLAEQPEAVREDLGLLEQIDLYAKAMAA